MNDGLPQGSVMAPLLCNVFTDVSNKKPDGIALVVQHKNIKLYKLTDTQYDPNTLKNCFRNVIESGARLNPAKTQVSCFHLNHRLEEPRTNKYRTSCMERYHYTMVWKNKTFTYNYEKTFFFLLI